MCVLLFFTLFIFFSEAADVFIGQGGGGGRCVRQTERVCVCVCVREWCVYVVCVCVCEWCVCVYEVCVCVCEWCVYMVCVVCMHV